MINRAKIRYQLERMVVFWMNKVDHYAIGVLEIEETEKSIRLVHSYFQEPTVIMEFKEV